MFKVLIPKKTVRHNRHWLSYRQESTGQWRAATGLCPPVAAVCLLAVLIVTMPAATAQPSCPAAAYPVLSSPSLHISDETASQLLASRHLAPRCRELAADLAQLYFWGAGGEQPELKRAWHFASVSKRDGRLHSRLRVLAAAFSLAGLNRNMSADEALRRFDRELQSDDLLRRDKAYAVLNQLQVFLPRVSLEGRSLFYDHRRTEAAPPASQGLSLNPSASTVLLADENGLPDLRWLGTGGLPPTTKIYSAGDEREMFYPKGVASDTLRWQRWDRRSPSGVLYSGFGFANGDYKESRCTATAIAPRWLLTAAHCLFASDRDIQSKGQSKLEVLRFAGHGTDRPALVEVESAWIHRRHRRQDLAANRLAAYSGSDIAVLRVAQGLDTTPIRSLDSLAGRADIQVRSSGFPRDKSNAGVWVNHCRASLVRPGEGELMDLYAMNCPFSVGQSGSLMTAREEGAGTGPAQGSAIGVLSANLSTATHKSAIFAAFNHDIISDIKRLLSPDDAPRYLVEFPIAGPTFATTSELAN